MNLVRRLRNFLNGPEQPGFYRMLDELAAKPVPSGPTISNALREVAQSLFKAVSLNPHDPNPKFRSFQLELVLD